jgi:hypothetical protein
VTPQSELLFDEYSDWLNSGTKLVQYDIPRDRYTRFSETVVISSDEQGGSRTNSQPEFAVGFAFGPQPFTAEGIHSALAARSCKLACSNRPYFHGSEDCDSCRLVAAKAIGSLPGDRFFISARWDHQQAPADAPKGALLHQYLITMALGVVQSLPEVRRLRVNIESVRGITLQSMTKWLREDLEVRLDTVIRYELPMAVLPVDCSIVAKKDPGIQVCDHLLWAEARLLNHADSTFWTHNNLVLSHAQSRAPYTLRFYCSKGTYYPPPDRIAPASPGAIPPDRLWLILATVEISVHRFAESPPVELLHLQPLLVRASRRIGNDDGLRDDAWRELHRAFVAIAGNYSKQPHLSDAERQLAADAERLSIMIARGVDGSIPSLFDQWRRERSSAIRRVLLSQTRV